MDVAGEQQNDIEHDVYKTRLDPYGNVIESEASFVGDSEIEVDSPVPEQSEKDFKKRSDIVRNVICIIRKNRQFIQLCEGKDVILVLGKTQAGKSTLYNALVHGILHQSKKRKEDGNVIKCLLPLVVNNDYPVAGIGNGLLSETKYPFAYPLPDGRVFLDTRGFFDSDVNDICSESAAAVLTHIAVSIAKSVKIVWIQPHALLKNNTIRDHDEIGGVLKKIVYKNAPILFIFNKQFSADPELSEDPEIRDVLFKQQFHVPGSEEDEWPLFHEFAMRDITMSLNEICESYLQDFKKMMTSKDDAKRESKSDFEKHAEERGGYLSFLKQNLEAGRVFYSDPRYLASIDQIKKAIEDIPPAIAKEDSPSEEKVLNFSDFSQGLTTFKNQFTIRLKEFTSILKAINFLKRYPILDLIELKKKELQKVKEDFEVILNQKNLEEVKAIERKYKEFLTGSLLSAKMSEQQSILDVISKTERAISEIENGKPFRLPHDFDEMSLFGIPTYTLKYDGPPFVGVEEELYGCECKEVIKNESPHFEAVYVSKKPDYDMFYAVEELSIKFQYSFLEFLSVVFGIRHCRGTVFFLIDRKIHDKDLLDHLRDLLDDQRKRLADNKMEIELSKGVKNGRNAVAMTLVNLENDITKLEAIMKFQGRLGKEYHHSKIRNYIDENGKRKREYLPSLMEEIDECKIIVETLFRGENEDVKAFYEELSYKPKETLFQDEDEALINEINIGTIFNESVRWAKELEPQFPGVVALFENIGLKELTSLFQLLSDGDK